MVTVKKYVKLTSKKIWEYDGGRSWTLELSRDWAPPLGGGKVAAVASHCGLANLSNLKKQKKKCEVMHM